MYSLNTQLAYFKNEAFRKKALINITWFKFSVIDLNIIKLQPLSKTELEKVLSFMEQNRLNFPGTFFCSEVFNEVRDVVLSSDVSHTAMPHYFVLSGKSDLYNENSLYARMKIVLRNPGDDGSIEYTVDFDIIGRIEIYKERKE